MKELRGGGGLRTKGTSLSKPNQSSTSSSSGGSTNTRDRSSPKRLKFNHRNTPPKRLPVARGNLGSTPEESQREEGGAIRGREQDAAFEQLTPVRCHREPLGPDSPPTWQPTAGDILCSTPKDSVGARGRGIRDRVVQQHMGVDHLTPVRCLAERRDEEQRQRRAGRRSNSEDGDRGNPKEGNDRRACIDHIHPDRVTGPPESQRAGPRGRRDHLLRAGGREEEERHLRWYHQQLQQITPLTALQSAHPSGSSLSSASASLSSSSNPPAVSASSSSSSSPRAALYPVAYHGLQELLTVYRAGIKIGAGAGDGHPDAGSGNLAARVQTSPGLLTKQHVDVRYERGVGEFCGAAGEGEGRESALAGEEAQRRWAWVTTTPTEETDVCTTAPLSQEVSGTSSTSDPEDLWRRTRLASSSDLVFEEEDNDDWIEGRHRGYRNNKQPFHREQSFCPRRDPSPQHLAPAERPLSPACEPTDHRLAGVRLSLASGDNNRSSNIAPPLPSPCPPPPLVITCKRESGRADVAVKREIPNSLCSQPQYPPAVAAQSGDEVSSRVLNRCREQPAEVHPCLIVKPRDSSLDESSAGPLSCGMDPLSLSQLEVSRQAASESFLPRCLPETEEVTRTVMALHSNDPKEDVEGNADLLWEMSK